MEVETVKWRRQDRVIWKKTRDRYRPIPEREKDCREHYRIGTADEDPVAKG
jgi:hypothetical protein